MSMENAKFDKEMFLFTLTLFGDEPKYKEYHYHQLWFNTITSPSSSMTRPCKIAQFTYVFEGLMKSMCVVSSKMVGHFPCEMAMSNGY